MKNKNILISICIPTYNGRYTIEKTIDSILIQDTSAIEIVISDDASTDGTYELLMEKLRKNKISKIIHRNHKNLGMDGNFSQTVKLASGKYIWFMGQDDLLLKNAISTVKKVLNSKNDIQLVYLNFKQKNSNDEIICESKFEEVMRNSEKVDEIQVINGSDEYFRIFYQAPTFLPSIILEKNIWDSELERKFQGTYYVQTGIILTKLDKSKIVSVKKTLVLGLVPSDKWQSNGNSLILIMTGNLRMNSIAFAINKNLPGQIFYRSVLRYVLNFPFLICEAKKRGFNRKGKLLKDIITIRPAVLGIFVYLFAAPLVLMPFALNKSVVFLLSPIKKILLRSETYQNLRK
jgi:glycosyltransferase involved in cell wall biosynthesis